MQRVRSQYGLRGIAISAWHDGGNGPVREVFDAFVVKPIDPQRLIETIRRVGSPGGPGPSTSVDEGGGRESADPRERDTDPRYRDTGIDVYRC